MNRLHEIAIRFLNQCGGFGWRSSSGLSRCLRSEVDEEVMSKLKLHDQCIEKSIGLSLADIFA